MKLIMKFVLTILSYAAFGIWYLYQPALALSFMIAGGSVIWMYEMKRQKLIDR